MKTFAAILLLATLLGETNAMAQCTGLDAGWSFGGRALDADVGDLVKNTSACPDNCTVQTPDGITYVISVSEPRSPSPVVPEPKSSTINGPTLSGRDIQTRSRILKMSRALVSGEHLPFGVIATDSPTSVVEKINKSGAAGGYEWNGLRHVVVGAGTWCGADQDHQYSFLFTFKDGHITGVSETPIIDGTLYVDDVTEFFKTSN